MPHLTELLTFKRNPYCLQLVSIIPLILASKTLVHALILSVASFFVLTMANCFVLTIRRSADSQTRFICYTLVLGTAISCVLELIQALSRQLHIDLHISIQFLAINLAIFTFIEKKCCGRNLRENLLGSLVTIAVLSIILIAFGVVSEILNYGTLFYSIEVLLPNASVIYLRWITDGLSVLLKPPIILIVLGLCWGLIQFANSKHTG